MRSCASHNTTTTTVKGTTTLQNIHTFSDTTSRFGEAPSSAEKNGVLKTACTGETG